MRRVWEDYVQDRQDVLTGLSISTRPWGFGVRGIRQQLDVLS